MMAALRSLARLSVLPDRPRALALPVADPLARPTWTGEARAAVAGT
jgi:hypothetical protein